MPSKGRIQSKDFQELLLELGVNQNGIPFDLRSEVTPVVLVGGTVSFVAAPTPAYRVIDIFSAGVQVAPAAGTVLADTGALTTGAFTLQLAINADEVNTFLVEWRNALNTATLVSVRLRLGSGLRPILWNSRFDIENANERVRITNVNAGTVAIEYFASILARI